MTVDWDPNAPTIWNKDSVSPGVAQEAEPPYMSCLTEGHAIRIWKLVHLEDKSCPKQAGSGFRDLIPPNHRELNSADLDWTWRTTEHSDEIHLIKDF